MKKFKFSIFTILFIASASFFSCDSSEQENTNDQNVDGELLASSAQIDFVNEMDFNTGVQLDSENSSGKLTSKTTFGTFDCAVVTIETPTTTIFPIVFHVDFGSGCLYNGILRKGKLKITVSNYITETGSTMTVERDNYYVNGTKVEGTVNYINETTNQTIPQWSRTITNGKLTNPEGTVFLHSGTHTVQQTLGFETLTLLDNVYQVTQGNHIITKQGGTSITLTVQEPLLKKFTCDYVSKGKLKVEGAILNGVIDYGNDECDNIGTYTHQNGMVFNFTM